MKTCVRGGLPGVAKWATFLVFGWMWLIQQPAIAQNQARETNPPPTLATAEQIVRPAVMPAVVFLYNQPIAILRAPLFGYSPSERARSAESRMAKLIREGTFDPVTTRETTEGVAFFMAGNRVLTIAPGDLDPLASETMKEVVQTTLSHLNNAVTIIREETGWRYLLRATMVAIGLTLILAGTLWLETRLWRWLRPRLALTQSRWKQRAEKKGFNLLPQLAQHLVTTGRTTVWIMAVFFVYHWIALVLRQFPYTRPWGEQMAGYVLAAIRPLAAGVFHWLPDLIVIVFILATAKLLVWLVRTGAVGVIRGKISTTWISPEAARPTSRILIVVIWLFAVVMLYPYLPGSNSAGFRSVAVFVGLLVSLGGTGLIGQVMGGFVLMYTRSLKKGDYVRAADQEGTVESVGFVSTRLRTPRNEVINVPNALLMSTTVINYSRLAESSGVMMPVKVGVGYNTPWRQVHALLLRAAERTTGTKKTPEPFVWERTLSDFYVEYELNVCVEDPEQRIQVLSDLCSHIQDEFNEHGVQVMSPHFMQNPPEKVWVPKEKWHTPPTLSSPPQSSA